MSDPNPTPPIPDGQPASSPPPDRTVTSAGQPSSPPLPGAMAAPPAPPVAPSAPPWPQGTPAFPPTGPPPSVGPPPQPGFAQAAAQPYVAQGYGDGFLPELGVTLGSKGKRVGAKTIDLVIVITVQVVVSIIFNLLVFSTADGFAGGGGNLGAMGLGAVVLTTAVLLVFDFVYNVVSTAQFGGTPGKLMLGLRVIRQDGPAADTTVAFRRWSPSFALIVLGAIPIIGIFAGLARFGLLIANLVMIFVDERRRDVFDHVANTYVIEKQ